MTPPAQAPAPAAPPPERSSRLRLPRETHLELDARSRHDTSLARFYRTRFRPEFQPAYTAWLAAHPFTNASATLAWVATLPVHLTS